MQCVLDFEAGNPSSKRRKALQACQSCRKSKKGCVLSPGSLQCQRCEQERRPCSFAQDALVSPPSRGPTDSASRNAPEGGDDGGLPAPADSAIPNLPNAAEKQIPASNGPPVTQTEWTPSSEPVLSATLTATESDLSPVDTTKELRYVTMLDILRGEKSPNPDSRYSSVKLISGTNPLSALLRRELKHKIVTNSCSFRTPDPAATVRRSLQRRGYGIHGYDWEQFYRDCGTSPARMQYLCAMGCFELPSPSECSHLLEIYFTRVHPLLPVVDRKEFLAAYYGSASPPSLLLLRAIFLAATRYTAGESGTSMEEIRPHCDDLHTKLRALIEAGLSMERIPVIQATIIASLHWEGREGLNSAIDNLSLAIRLCQEMGLHRKVLIDQSPAPANHILLRRIWWVVYALDRFNAAQEGTPFLINEIDCDVEPLSKADLQDEDPLTCKVTLLNMSMALLIEEAIRKLYAPGEDHTTLFTPRGALLRQQLSLSLERLANDITQDLTPCQQIQDVLQNAENSPPAVWCIFLLTHLDAIRILVHRPFLLYVDAREVSSYTSRDFCRNHAQDIICRLQALQSQNLLRLSWPFTVYALVNSLLVFWYDISSPQTVDNTIQVQSRQRFSSVTELLREVGSVWWAAAAKYRLALALAAVADEMRARGRRAAMSVDRQNTQPSGVSSSLDMPKDGRDFSESTLEGLAEEALFNDGDFGNIDFWASIGLEFDSEVASGIYGISDTM